MSTTNNRVRSHQLSFRLTEKEISRWNQKQKASGLNKTEFLLKILDKSDVKIYQFNNSDFPSRKPHSARGRVHLRLPSG